MHPDLRAGDCVRFRDLSAAAVKYQDSEGSGRHFDRVSTGVTGGWDVNVFNVLSKRQTVKVLWYDGSVSEAESNILSKFALFEDNMRPTDIVVNRTGLRMKPSEVTVIGSTETRAFVEFNEMKFYRTTSRSGATESWHHTVPWMRAREWRVSDGMRLPVYCFKMQVHTCHNRHSLDL